MTGEGDSEGEMSERSDDKDRQRLKRRRRLRGKDFGKGMILEKDEELKTRKKKQRGKK